MAKDLFSGDEITRSVLAWYDEHARDLPWRISPGDRRVGVLPDPYRVWLSEIMLQQTTIAHATRYFIDFTTRWPTVDALAAADRDDVMNAWAGLGYYSRARNLHTCAITVSAQGGFPDTAKELIGLPGIGPYTAGAVAAIAFDKPEAAVDGNVERVISRLFAFEEPITETKSEIRKITADWVPEDRPGDFAQAMMDLGATVCTPRSPDCDLCPVSSFCKGLETGKPDRFPVKAPKKAQPMRHGVAYIVVKEGQILVERRGEKGLLAGTLGLPTSTWSEVSEIPWSGTSAEVDGKWLGRIEHVFTHFRLFLDVVEIEREAEPHQHWIDIDSAENAGFPSVFSKAVKLALRYVPDKN